MADYKVSDSSLISVADAIRTKGGTSASLSFPDGFVTAIGNIQTGGGSTLITKSITANGTYNASSDNADGYSSVTVAVPSKLVTGTFTGSSAGAAMNVSIPYTGNGYPVACLIYPTPGPWKVDSTFYSTAKNLAIGLFSMVKTDISATPSYSNAGQVDYGTVAIMYKTSDSDATKTTGTRVLNAINYRNANATESAGDCVRFKDKSTMSVFIGSTNYGFMANLEYTYMIIYSS